MTQLSLEERIRALCVRMAKIPMKPPAWLDKDGIHFSKNCPAALKVHLRAEYDEMGKVVAE